ncbi:MAG: mechanosensitive ion channel family protein [Granulosicoccus sp.]
MKAPLLCILLIIYATSAVAQTDILSDVLGTDTSSGSTASGPEGDIKIDVENTDLGDTEIRQRLISILSEIDRLQQVTVSVSNSVVQLQGQVESNEAKTEANTLATALEGVVKVDNQVEVTRDVSVRVRSTWQRLLQLGADSRSILPLALLATGTVILFWYLAKIVARQTRLWSKLAPNAFIATIIGSVVRLIILITGIVLALYLLDATSIITTLLGAAGIVGLALGFAVRDTVENFVASILLSLRQPFQMNDFVQIDSYSGSVARLTGRATILISADGNQIRIPNSVVFKSTITNFTRHTQRRFSLSVPVDESENLVKARKIVLEAIGSIPGVLLTPGAQVHIQSLGEATIELSVFAWIDQQTHDLLKVQTASAVAIKHALKSAGIVMPQSVHTLKVIDSQPLQEEPDSPLSKPRFQAAPDVEQRSTEQANKKIVEQTDAELSTHIKPEDDSAVSLQLEEEQTGSQNLLTEGRTE